MTRVAYLKVLTALVASLVGIFVSPADAGNRIALVIGNSNYENTPALSNPVNDADDLAAALRRVGFDVDLERNLTKQGMEAAITRFSRKAQGADAALFYYAGHGMQYRGGNYLMPVDARLEDEFNLNFELTRLDDVLFGLERASGVKILILDSCRNNPLLDRLTRSTKSASRDLLATRGLAKIDAARGMIVAYSTQPNQVAVDGAGRNSPFTSALVKYIGEPGLEVGTLFRRVAIDVNRVTQGRQLPELSVSLLGEFYLNTHDTDVQAWAKVRYSSDPTKLKEFISSYPKSLLGTDAKQIVDRIERETRARAEREQAERDRLEKERQAQYEAERKRIEQELKSKQVQQQLLRLEQERAEQARLAREKAAHDELVRAEEERSRVAREAAERIKMSTNTPANPQIAMLPPPTQQSYPDIKNDPATITPADPKTTSANQFNGLWQITWTGLTNCTLKSGTYVLKIRDGVVVGKQRGNISNSGTAQWNSLSRFGANVNYLGRFSGDSGSGQFQNEKGCQGTFVARKTTGGETNKIASRPPPASMPSGDATKESFKISGPGTIRTGQSVVLTAPNGRKMTCTGGSMGSAHRPRTCFWN